MAASIAQIMNMARRLGAIAGIIVILGLVLALVWRVYLHHRDSGVGEDEPAVVLLDPPVSGKIFGVSLQTTDWQMVPGLARTLL